MLDAPRFSDWLGSTAPQDKAFVYARGNLGQMRAQRSAMRAKDPDAIIAPGIDRACDNANAAWRAYELGLVELVQQRDPDGGVNYLAIRRKRTRPQW